MPRRNIHYIVIKGSEHNYNVEVYFRNVPKPKVFTLWTWNDHDDEPNGEMPYICSRECEEIHLDELVDLGEFKGLWETIDNGGYVWITSNKLEGQQL